MYTDVRLSMVNRQASRNTDKKVILVVGKRGNRSRGGNKRGFPRLRELKRREKRRSKVEGAKEGRKKRV